MRVKKSSSKTTPTRSVTHDSALDVVPGVLPLNEGTYVAFYASHWYRSADDTLSQGFFLTHSPALALSFSPFSLAEPSAQSLRAAPESSRTTYGFRGTFVRAGRQRGGPCQ